MKGRHTQNIFRIVLLIGLIALAGGAIWYWLRPARVTTTEVTERRIAPSIQGIGTIESKIVVMVASKITGRIIDINVDQGDTVLPGQMLATLEDTESRAEADRAEATMQRARSTADVQQAAITRALSGVEVQRAAVQRVLTSLEVPRIGLRRARFALSAAESNIVKARAIREQAQKNADRWNILLRSGDVSKMETEERLTQLKAADEDVKNSEAQRNTAIEDVKNIEAQIKAAGDDLTQARAQLKAANDDVATLRSGLKVIEQDIAVAKASLASVNARKNDTEIISQIGGYVVSRELEPGAIVNPGTPILKIADPTTLWATVFVDESSTRAFQPGDIAEITVRSMPTGILRGKVARLQRESDRVTEQLAVDVSFDEIPADLRLGEQVDAVIKSAPRTVKVIPASALFRSKDGLGVWVVEDGRLRFRKVQTGMIDASGWAEVLSGVENGDKIVVTPGKLADLSNEGRTVSEVDEKTETESQVNR